MVALAFAPSFDARPMVIAETPTANRVHGGRGVKIAKVQYILEIVRLDVVEGTIAILTFWHDARIALAAILVPPRLTPRRTESRVGPACSW